MIFDQIAEVLRTPWAILLALLFLSASIFVHELGHFLAARWRGLVVDRFSIGFGPRVVGWRRNGVDWRISAIPLGGYVSLPQLADMRMIEGESEHDTTRLPRISYTDKVIVSVAGAAFNILFALALGTVLWIAGRPAYGSELTTTVGFVPPALVNEEGGQIPGPAYVAGIRAGDRIIAIDGQKVGSWTEISEAVLFGAGRTSEGERLTRVTLERDGVQQVVDVRPVVLEPEGLRQLGLLPKQRSFIDGVMEDSPADRAGLQEGDEVVAIDGQPVLSFAATSGILSSTPATEHVLTVRRGEERLDFTVKPALARRGDEERLLVGITWGVNRSARVLVHENPLKQVWDALEMTFGGLWALVNPRSDVGLGNMNGPVGIVHAFVLTVEEGLALVLFLTLLINVNLAIVNLLPIPVLDGGHVLFATIEKLRRNAIPIRTLVATQNAFMLLILCLFFYISFNDIGRLFGQNGAESGTWQFVEE